MAGAGGAFGLHTVNPGATSASYMIPQHHQEQLLSTELGITQSICAYGDGEEWYSSGYIPGSTLDNLMMWTKYRVSHTRGIYSTIESLTPYFL